MPPRRCAETSRGRQAMTADFGGAISIKDFRRASVARDRASSRCCAGHEAYFVTFKRHAEAMSIIASSRAAISFEMTSRYASAQPRFQAY